MKSVFFIPIYNQVNELPVVLNELKESGPCCDEILLVNNGSNDGSEDLVRKAGYPYLDFQKSNGVGYGFIKSIEWALERDFDIFGGLAGNAKMLPSEMPRLLDPILNDQAEYVTGSRFLDGGSSPNLPKFRKKSIPMVNKLVKILYGVGISDATCGYRAYKIDIIRRANFDWTAPWLYSYGFEYYIYAKVLLDNSIRIKEVPVTMRYPKKGLPYSKIKPFSGWWKLLKPWLIASFDGKGFHPLDRT